MANSFKNYTNWGCEFVSESIHAPPRRYISDAYWLPVELLELASTQEVSRSRVNARAIEISESGLQNPGELIVGSNACYLKDGNHRFKAVQQLGWRHFPVTIRTSDEPIRAGLSLSILIEELLKASSIIKYTKENP